MLRGGRKPASVTDFHPGLYGDIRRRVANNVLYLANLLALRQWYLHVRRSFPGDPEMGEALWKGAMEIVDAALTERLTRFKALADKMGKSIELGERFLPEEGRANILRQQREFRERWPELETCLTDRREEKAGRRERDGFLAKLTVVREAQGNDYIRVIRSLDPDVSVLGTRWLQQAVDSVAEPSLSCVPCCRA